MDKKEIIRIIREKYIYFDSLENALKDELYALLHIEADEKFFLKLQFLLDKFYDPHTKIVRKEKNEYILPIYLGIIGEKLVVIEDNIYYPNIRKGFILESINYVCIEEILRKFNKMNSTTLKLIKILELISSSKGYKQIILTFKTENLDIIEEKIKYTRSDLTKFDIKKYNNLLLINKKQIEKKYDISYYYCPSLMSDNEINELMNSLINDNIKHNVIFDIRNNIGGKVDLTMKLVELFIDEEEKIFLKSTKNIYEYILTPKNSLLKEKNVGILFNNLTCSSLEFIFLRLLMKRNNILFMGTPTCGMKDIATIYELNSNYIMSLTTKKYVDFNGKSMDIKYIEPQIYIGTNINDLNKDAQLEKAIYILKNK